MTKKSKQSASKRLTNQYEHLAANRKLQFPLAVSRRFFAIEGLDLGGLLALELFTVIIPLILIGFSYLNHFSTDVSFGDALIQQLDLKGANADLVRSAFGSSASLSSTWTVLGLAGFLVWGIPMSSQVARVFANAWQRERFTFMREVAHGGVWFVLYLVCQSMTSIVVDNSNGGVWFVVRFAVSLLPAFVFWSITPAILIRDGHAGWRHYAKCGLAGVVIEAILLRIAARIALPILIGGWVPFGPIGVALAFMTWCGVVAICWVVTACVGAVIWERNAPADVVIAAQTDVLADESSREPDDEPSEQTVEPSTAEIVEIVDQPVIDQGG